MRVHLKGIHKVKSKGQTYYYAWRGGPRINAKPGSPDFIQQYNTAQAERKKVPANCLFTLIAEFKASSGFPKGAATQKEYRRYLGIIEEQFGTMPLKAVEDRRARGVFMEWRDTLKATPRKADYAWSVLARVLSFGKDRGRITTNVCEGGGRLYEARRQEKIWTPDHISRFKAEARAELHLALVLALWTGQRQGDLLKLRWSDYQDRKIRVFQSKGQKWVTIPVGDTLADWLKMAPMRALTILTGQRGRPWTGDGFRTEWGKVCERAGIDDVTFHDLRGTAVTRLAKAGCSVAEIASLTGHALKDAQAILDAHYLGGRLELAEAAMAKLEEKEGRTKAVKLGVKPD
ncbi:MAG TPA: tyrosine-type recombinase/integrase [Microvirga sp.]|jgi:integrase|nr:tyrosine-type recombinase/integrase [Microvirga sp.]